MNPELFNQVGSQFGANGLPYPLPIHPNLVHLTLGLFIIGIAFDIAGALFPLERSILKFLSLTAVRSNFFDVGWYNVLAAAIVTFFTVAAGFYEILLATPPTDVVSAWGLNALETMLWHGVGGVLLLTLMVGMAVWRGFQRFKWRKDRTSQVQWSYILAGLLILFVMYLHGTLGAQLAGEFGVHITADRVLRLGQDANAVLQ
jgi:uncharacterized membrane protein